MTFRESNFVSVESQKLPSDKTPKIVLRCGNRTIEVAGAVLETQFSDGDRHLLFVTEDIPYEESLHILLVDSELLLIDSLVLSENYAPGILKNICAIQPNKIVFSFFDAKERWHLTVADKPFIQLWGNKRLIKRESPLLHKTWLTLEKP